MCAVLSGRRVVAALLSLMVWVLTPGPPSVVQAAPSASHVCAGYNSPGTTTVSCAFSYGTEKQLQSLLWQAALPVQWELDSASGDGSPEVSSNLQDIVFTGVLTNNPVVFEFLVSVPAGQAGPTQFRGHVEYQLEGMTNPASIWANPDPLVVDSHHRIDASAGAHGLIDPLGMIVIVHGGSTNFNMVADPYYHISSVVVDAAPVAVTSSYAFTSVTGDHAIAVSFTENLACKGTPEWWLALYGLTNGTLDFCAAETNDTDTDGAPAWEEWVGDTIPTNADSVLTFVDIYRTSGDVRLEWKGGTNAWQLLEAHQDLVETTAQWTAILTNSAPTPAVTNFLHQNVTNRLLFYRLRAWRQ